ncbi:MAG: cbb3-type cytochrome c oxidase subunit 3 [Magnetococcales bacterium]|nr:cbb3-type cytochrome c oxidase subunit 3 [Magnetococcales bacterium]
MNFNEMMLFSKQFSLVWFFLIFVIVLFWAFRPSHKKRYEEAGRSILREDDEPAPPASPPAASSAAPPPPSAAPDR